MESLMLKIWLWVTVALVFQMNGNHCCLESERKALLEIKVFFQSISSYDSDQILPSWVDDDDHNMSDCCGWEMLKCNATTGRVVELLLNATTLQDEWLNSYGTCDCYGHHPTMNASLFHAFEELQTLDLSEHCYVGIWSDDKGYDIFQNLKQLKVLNLERNCLDGSIFTYLSPLTSLTSLSLRINEIESIPLEHGESKLGSLKNLKTLDLGFNNLNETIFSHLVNLTSLTTLILDSNYIKRVTSKNSYDTFQNLKQLKVLILDSTNLDESILTHLTHLTSLTTLILSNNEIKSIPLEYGYDTFQNLKQLKVLNLDRNNLDESIFKHLAPLTSLTTLILSDNEIKSIPLEYGLAKFKSLGKLDLGRNQINNTLSQLEICELKNLIWLDLTDNNISGLLPDCLSHLTKLKFFELYQNQLSGNLNFPKLASLEFMGLYENNFDGLLSLSSFANFSKLEFLEISSRNDKFQAVNENFPWVPAFQLQSLILNNCNLKGTIPSFLMSQYNLHHVDLSHNELAGQFPFWLLQNNTNLKNLHLRNNSFNGTLQLPDSKHGLEDLDISRNGFSGHIPMDIGMILPSLSFLNMSGNRFQGNNTPPSMGEMKNLAYLDLSTNDFSGELLKYVITDCTSLGFLELSNNTLSGQIFPKYANLTYLRWLFLNDNHFHGNIGTGLLNSNQLEIIDISNNNISGHVPQWMGNFSYLQALLISGNSLGGTFPFQIVNNLGQLISIDISENKISGPITSFNASSMQFLYMQKNALIGPIPKALFKSTELLILDLSDNRFSGDIQHIITDHSSIRVLLLGGNQLQGQIPHQLCKLRDLHIMDLSGNKFNGSIPSCFSDLQYWSTLDFQDDRYYYGVYGGMSFVGDIYYNDSLGTHLGTSRDAVVAREFKAKFLNKNRYDSYKGKILKYMTLLDMSSNELTGKIPMEFGELRKVHALNLSHNGLSGAIPSSFSNLQNMESLDLSQNKLTGIIPPQLSELTFLAIFNVAYNNLSGPIPNGNQFTLFDGSNYKGNPNLCGPAVNKSCLNESINKSYPRELPIKDDDESTFVDMVIFYWSFGASYVTMLFGVLLILLLNSHWRNLWFGFVDACIYSCFGWLFRYLYYRRLYRP